jgi:light-regulated signal transduction histidine kinase (bacteriophytochrome)
LNILGFSKELARCCQQLQEMLKSEFPDTLARRATRLALEQEIPEALHFIQASAQKMDGLLAGLLRLSRLGRQPLAMVDVNMNRLLAQVLETLKYQALVSRAEIELGDLPPCRGDAMQLNQLFTNLLENALKYLQPQRPGRIKLSGSVSSEAVIYCVEDNGMGIASEHQERVFELFHRLMPNRCAGEGLGLAIAHRIAARHRGKIWVESISEAGSSFFVSLPL